MFNYVVVSKEKGGGRVEGTRNHNKIRMSRPKRSLVERFIIWVGLQNMHSAFLLRGLKTTRLWYMGDDDLVPILNKYWHKWGS